jgi:hypothetical protein
MLTAGQFVELFLPKHPGLVQETVQQRRLPVVNMRNYRHITNMV